MAKRKQRGRAKPETPTPKAEKLTERDVENLMRHDGYERRGGVIKQTRRGS